MDDDYESATPYPIAMPRWERLSDSEWVRSWEIRLVASPAPPNLHKLDCLSEDGIDVSVSVGPDRRTLQIRTTTKQDPYSDDIFVRAAFRMINWIDDNVERIELIQGQSREKWRPFTAALRETRH